MLAEYRSSLAGITGPHPMLRLAMHYHRLDDGTETGKAMSFLDAPYLVEWYTALEQCPDLVAMKCTQVYFTESVNLFGVMQSGERGRRHALVMPDEDVVRTFVQERIQPMFDRVPYYGELSRRADRTKTADNLRLRHVGRGSWRFVGSRKPAKLRSFPADSIVIDEVDECMVGNLELVRDRVRNSENPQIIRIGNPKLTTGGVAKMYERSDQRQWYQRCPRCYEYQRVTWFESVVEQDDAGRWVPRDRERAGGLSQAIIDPTLAMDIRPVCRRCKQPWTRTAEGSLWVAENPGPARRGYHVTQMDHLGRRLWPLFLQWLDAQDSPDDLAIFYSNVLGIPYEPKGSRLTSVDLRNCIRDYEIDHAGGEEYKPLTVVAGVDVGKVLHCKISTVENRHVDPTDEDSEEYACRKAMFVGSLPGWDELKEKTLAFHIDLMVIDAGPEYHSAREFRDWAHRYTRTRVWLCEYHPTPKIGVMPYGMKLKGAEFIVQVDKTAVMDETFKEIRQARREYPEDVLHALGWLEHMKAPVRKLETSARGERYVWDRGTKRDDYRQAECYERIAFDLLTLTGGIIEIPL